MKFAFDTVLLSLPLLASAASIPNPLGMTCPIGSKVQQLTSPSTAKRDCVVNAAYDRDWTEDGLRRYRTRFSSAGTPTDSFCDYFTSRRGDLGCFLASNVQCYNSASQGSWVADANFADGPGGRDHYFNCLTGARNEWIKVTGCRTG